MNDENKKHLEAAMFTLAADPEAGIFSSAKFLSLKENEREKLFERFPSLRNSGLELKDIEDYSRNFYVISKRPIEKLLKKSVEDLAGKNSQDSYGGWPLVSEEYLWELRSDLKEAITDFAKIYRMENKRSLLPTPWTNSLVILFLKKWLMYLTHNDIDETKSKIQEAIERGENWLRKCALKSLEGGQDGWPFFNPEVTNKVHAFETSISLIALNYDVAKNVFHESERVGFYGEKYIKTLIRPTIWREDGAVRKEEDGEIDSGATSYCISCLSKYYEEVKESPLKKEVEFKAKKSAEWLVANQKVDINPADGLGWGEKGKDLNDKCRIEKTAYALFALTQYRKTFPEAWINGNAINRAIDEGVSSLNRKMIKFGRFTQGWPNDYDDNNPYSIKNSSLAISALLRCDVPAYNRFVMEGINGLSREYDNVKSIKKQTTEECIYFYCVLADYLKAM